MRHRTGRRKLNRTSAHRIAMLKNLVSSLFLVKPDEENGTLERVVTTREKAKEARRLAEKVITLGRRGTLAARRRAIQLLGNKAAVRRVFDDIAPRYPNRPGGYTRIIGFPANRLGDNARQVIFELVEPAAAGAAARPVRPEVAEEVAAERESPPAADQPAPEEEPAGESDEEEEETDDETEEGEQDETKPGQ